MICKHSRLRCLLVLWLLAITHLSAVVCGGEPKTEMIRVMSFNLWHGGDAGKQPLARTVEVIKQAQADVVGLQETAGFAAGGARPDRAAEIAQALGWNYLDQGGRTGVISRFKMVSSTPRKWGVKLETPAGRSFYLFNAHFAHAPYQPYQLLKIPYANAPFLKTADEAVQAARDARGGQVARMLAEVKAILPEETPVFVTGDFNEPSHRDWTTAAAEAKQCPLAVAWPTTAAIEAAGFVDAYRSIYPDPVERPGRTWTPITQLDDPKDRHDRIDFVLVRGTNVKIKSAQVVGEKEEFADIVVSPYPSDHRAVVAVVELGGVTTTQAK
jgi:endonuclease/exonuclease/phosphatase family metal-dependent hydrolase